MSISRARRNAASLTVAMMAVSALVAGGLTARASEVVDTEQHSTRTELKYTDRANDAKDKFHGKVTSSSNKCVGDRAVKVFRVKKDGTTDRVGGDSTDGEGLWKVPAKDAKGKYFVTVEKDVRSKRVTGEDNPRNNDEVISIVCKPFSSKNSPLKLRL